MRLRFAPVLLLLTLSSNPVAASTPAGTRPFTRVEARRAIDSIRTSIKAKVGVSIIGLESRDTLRFDGSGHYPMQSVYKFPLAMAVMHLVDQKKLSLDSILHLGKNDLLPETWSPLRDKYPSRTADVPVREVLRQTLSASDNNGCDILFRLVGGPAKVQAYIHSLGIRNIAIAATEDEMHRIPKTQFTNWCEPDAMASLLDVFYRGKHLADSSTALLRTMMEETTTGPNRIKGMLPQGTVVAHKTGSSGKNPKGITYAINDVGIVTLPNGKHFAIVVYVSDSKAANTDLEQLIAGIAEVAWRYFSR